MTSSPGLRGWSRLRARRECYRRWQTTTDDRRWQTPATVTNLPSPLYYV